MKKKFRYMAAGAALLLSLCGCSEEQSAVTVIRADELTLAATAADWFAGVVVSDNAVQIPKEADKNIDELLVVKGAMVTEGDKLFSYDTDELNLTLDKQELELARLDAEIKDTKEQITTVKKEIEEFKKNKTDTTNKELQLRQLNMDLTQAEYNKSALNAEITYTKGMLQNVSVYSPVSGTVRSIDETNSESYIVIQQTGAYRVKGVLNEMSMGMGIMEGTAVQIVSRLNPDQVWNGIVELVDYENAEQNSYDQMYYGMVAAESTTNSSSYPFYITLESTEGLLLGQHVYIQLATADIAPDSLYVPESYLVDVTTDPLGMPTASVWMVGEEGVLIKKIVGLGEYDLNTGSYQILSGLTGEDYVADPANPGCVEGAEVILPTEAEDADRDEPQEENETAPEELDEPSDPFDDTTETTVESVTYYPDEAPIL